MAKRPRRKSRLNRRPVPVATDAAIERLMRFLTWRFKWLPRPVTHVSRARTLDNGFAADLQLFDGTRCILVVRNWQGDDPDERWYMKGKYKPAGPSGFYWNPVDKVWVRATEEEAKAATAAGNCL
ncbi:hypothetical protein SAMN04487843_105147 [Methylobacterium sp. ap11]|uniref:hypothetical protein n=1 Tax=Methylobacterium sp. ap11 TaxID=1761799 RepID=UPI0008BCBBBB|nr:hypothetical protein [Methylobacterium sp. ap11]SEO94863.1 hypothetical protein SAMN04487843_105147 [Methylobacterium sp. ap11]